jgi:CHASE3 domain sensor protein
MFRWTTDHRIKLGFSLAFALLAAVPLVVYSNKEKLVESNRQVAHTYEVIATLEATLRSLSDAETVERGFVITGDESYVAPYEATCFQTRNLVAKLQNLTADTPRSSDVSRGSSRSWRPSSHLWTKSSPPGERPASMRRQRSSPPARASASWTKSADW